MAIPVFQTESVDRIEWAGARQIRGSSGAGRVRTDGVRGPLRRAFVGTRSGSEVWGFSRAKSDWNGVAHERRQRSGLPTAREPKAGAFRGRLRRFVDRNSGPLDCGLEVPPGRLDALIGREAASGVFVQPALDVLPGRPADGASLAFVPERTAAQSQDVLGFIRADEDSSLVQFASVRVGHRRRQFSEREKGSEHPRRWASTTACTTLSVADRPLGLPSRPGGVRASAGLSVPARSEKHAWDRVRVLVLRLHGVLQVLRVLLQRSGVLHHVSGRPRTVGPVAGASRTTAAVGTRRRVEGARDPR